MTNALLVYIIISSGLRSTTYNWNEKNCGDEGTPKICTNGAITASGVPLDNKLPQAAVAVPRNLRLRPVYVCLKTKEGKEAWVHIIDKMHHRFIGERGFDLTPKALEMLGIRPNKHWSGEIYIC